VSKRGLKAAALTLLVAACDGPAKNEATANQVGNVRTQGVVAARVNDDVISLAEVEALVRSSGLSPKAALGRLVDERLLSQYATSRGYGELGSVGMELERARVRALLEQVVEREVSAASVTADEISARLEELKRRQPGVVAPSLEEATPVLREQLLNEHRRERLDRFVREIRDQTRVTYDEPAISRIMDEATGGTGS
jgi:hypothetical protein